MEGVGRGVIEGGQSVGERSIRIRNMAVHAVIACGLRCSGVAIVKNGVGWENVKRLGATVSPVIIPGVVQRSVRRGLHGGHHAIVTSKIERSGGVGLSEHDLCLGSSRLPREVVGLLEELCKLPSCQINVARLCDAW